MILVLCFSLLNVNAAIINKLKTATQSTSYGTFKVTDTAHKNNTTGGWTFTVGTANLVLTSGFGARAYASQYGVNPILTNNGNTAKHSVVWTIYRQSSGQDTGSGGMETFTFTYNPSTGQIS